MGAIGLKPSPNSVCVAPIEYTGQAELQRDIDNFKAALKIVKVEEAFLPVAAPASVIPDRKNEYYANDEACVEAIGQAMHTEYKMIVDAGFLVQLDDARAAVTYDRMVPPASFKDYRKWVARHMDVLNAATKGIPTDKIRYHVCWGSWPGPHTTDVPLKDIVDLILRVRAGAYVIEGANPRHEHEWRVWENVKLPAGSVLIPGVISHATNVVEHPELVAERIVRLARLVGARTSSPAPTAVSRSSRSSSACIRRSYGRSSKPWSKARASRARSSGENPSAPRQSDPRPKRAVKKRDTQAAASVFPSACADFPALHLQCLTKGETVGRQRRRDGVLATHCRRSGNELESRHLWSHRRILAKFTRARRDGEQRRPISRR